MTSEVRRAGAFAAVGTLALVAPLHEQVSALAFMAVAAAAAFGIREGRLFELFARPGDHRDGKLYGLAGFALAATALAILTMAPQVPMPITAFVGTVFLVAYGNLGERLVRTRGGPAVLGMAGFGIAGFVAAAGGMLAAVEIGSLDAIEPSKVVFLAASGTLLAALLRSVLFERDDPLVMVSTGLLLWFLSELMMPRTLPAVIGALAVTLALGYASYAMGTASIPGMLTGVFLGLLTLVLGGVGWFVVLISFFALGGLSTKFRYEVKLARGVAEDNAGVRGSGNVLGNASVALFALLAYAAADSGLFPTSLGPLEHTNIYMYAFAGSVAAAMSDTLSSEIGGIFDNPRLITTFRRVEPGTDGGVTWQGLVAGTAGGLVVAGLTLALFPEVGLAGAAVVALAGFVGMNVDSLIGATLENRVLGNQGVNFLGTLAGAIAAAVGILILGI